MENINDKHYKGLDLSKAVAFELAFYSPMIYEYDDAPAPVTFYQRTCSECNKVVQYKDFRVPRASVKDRKYGYLQSYDFGVNQEIRDCLIKNFDISEDDFRPVRTKADEIIMWQIEPRHDLRPIHEINGMPVIEHCTKCGYYYCKFNSQMHGEYHYFYMTRDVLENMSDLNKTCESISITGHYLPVVSRRVYDYLIERYPRMMFNPFFLKDN